MCDIARQLSKFHTCAHMPPGVTCEDKAIAKAKAYLLTDSNTPVISDICKSIVRSLGTETRITAPLTWWSRFDPETQFPNEYDTWMDDVIARDLPELNRKALLEWCARVQWPRAPTVAEVAPELPTDIPLIVDGDLVNTS